MIALVDQLNVSEKKGKKNDVVRKNEVDNNLENHYIATEKVQQKMVQAIPCTNKQLVRGGREQYLRSLGNKEIQLCFS